MKKYSRYQIAGAIYTVCAFGIAMLIPSLYNTSQYGTVMVAEFYITICAILARACYHQIWDWRDETAE